MLMSIKIVTLCVDKPKRNARSVTLGKKTYRMTKFGRGEGDVTDLHMARKT